MFLFLYVRKGGCKPASRGGKGDTIHPETRHEMKKHGFVSCCLCLCFWLALPCLETEFTEERDREGNRIRYLIFFIPPFLVSSSAAPDDCHAILVIAVRA